MRKGRGFTLIEILITVAIIGILGGISFVIYSRTVEKARSTEAYITIDAIRTAEESYKAETGSYVTAEDIDEINKLFGLGVAPKYYNFRVVLPDEDSYIVIAQRLGEDIEAYLADAQLPPEPIVIAMGDSGYVDRGFGIYLGTGGSSGTGTGGSSGTGGSGGTVITGGVGGGGVGNPPSANVTPPPQVYDSDIVSALNMLDGSSAGQYYYDLIERKNISVIYDDFTQYGASPNTIGLWQGLDPNTIYVNENLKTTAPESLIASIIVHEAVHADYAYNPETLIAATLERHSELSRANLSIKRNELGQEMMYSFEDPEIGDTRRVFLNSSLDQEYVAFSNELELWKEIKGTDADSSQDRDLAFYEQGEAALKDELKTRGSYASLPEY